MGDLDDDVVGPGASRATTELDRSGSLQDDGRGFDGGLSLLWTAGDSVVSPGDVSINLH